MFRRRWQIFFLIVFAVSLHSVCCSQTISNDSLEYQRQVELFDEVVGIENTPIINGPKHAVPFQTSDTHPFYNSPIGAKGTLSFGGQPYFNLTLLYDVFSDELVVQQLRSTGTQESIVLNKAKVQSFRIHDHSFRNFSETQAQSLGISGGFYDVLFESGEFKILARRKKNTKIDLGRVVFESEDRYLFIRNGKKATSFRGMKDLYNMFGDKAQRAELSAFVSKNNLKVRKSDSDLVTAAGYCDTILSKQK